MCHFPLRGFSRVFPGTICPSSTKAGAGRTKQHSTRVSAAVVVVSNRRCGLSSPFNWEPDCSLGISIWPLTSLTAPHHLDGNLHNAKSNSEYLRHGPASGPARAICGLASEQASDSLRKAMCYTYPGIKYSLRCSYAWPAWSVSSLLPSPWPFGWFSLLVRVLT